MKASMLSGQKLRGAWEAPIVMFAAYVLGMALLVASSFIDFRNASELEASNNNVSHTLEAMDKLRQIGNTFFVAETSLRAYIITGNAEYLEPYRDMQQRIPLHLAEVSQLVSDTPEQRASVDTLRVLASAKFEEMDRTLDAYRSGGQAGAIAMVSKGDALGSTAGIRERIRLMLAEESRLLAERHATAATTYSTGLARAAVSTGIVGLALTAFFLLMHRFLRQRDAALKLIEASNAALEQRVIDRTADLSHLSRHLLNVREHEKKVIARDLHDEFGSYLTAINMDLSRTRDKIATTNPEQAAKLERTLGLLGSAIEMKRQLISDLRPSLLDNLGLGPALEQYIDEWSRRTGIAATFDHEGELVSNDEGCPIAIFRVFQEALTNVAKHSGATRVASHAYRVGEAIEFEIADNGVGTTDADRAKPGIHGLLGIRERILAYRGHVEFSAGKDGGTTLRGTMPCHLSEADAEPRPFVMNFA